MQARSFAGLAHRHFNTQLHVGYEEGRVEATRDTEEAEVRSSPRQRRFSGQRRTLKELNQEHLRSGLNYKQDP